MAVVATDDFNRDDGGLGTDWTTIHNAPAISSNQVVAPTSDTAARAFWNADAVDDAQYAEITIITVAYYDSALIRAVSTPDFVAMEGQNAENKWVLSWYDAGEWTHIGSDYATTPADNDVARIEAEGTTVRGYVNSVERISGSNAGIPSSGSGGFSTRNTGGTSGVLDNFEVGNLAEVTLEIEVVMDGAGYQKTGVRVW